jgi:hypothetical protein
MIPLSFDLRICCISSNAPKSTQTIPLPKLYTLLGISLNTLYRMEKGGLLSPFRTPGGHRRYPVEMLDLYLEGSRDENARATFAHQ